MLLLAGYFLGLTFLPAGPPSAFVLGLVPIVLIGFALLVTRFVRLAKDRLATSLFFCCCGLATATGGLLAFRAFLKSARRVEEP